MKIMSNFWILCLGLLFSFAACKSIPTTTGNYKSKEEVKLVMSEGEGTNGAAVAYHPTFKRYYACFAGNEYYPLEAFDTKGNRLYKTTVGFDARGLWYNPVKNTIEGNAYDNGGIYNYTLNEKGEVESTNALNFQVLQPDAQSVGAYDYHLNQVNFLYEGSIHKINRNDGEEVGKINLKNLQLYNMSDALVYTGLKNGEWGVLDITQNKVLLFDKNTGEQTGAVQIPKSVKLQGSFNFAYANGRFWIFDIENRTWRGFKLK